MSLHPRPERERYQYDIAPLRNLPCSDACDRIAEQYVGHLRTAMFPRKYRMLNEHDLLDCGQAVLEIYVTNRPLLRFLMNVETIDAFVQENAGVRALEAWLRKAFKNVCNHQIRHRTRMVLVPPDALEVAADSVDFLEIQEFWAIIDRLILELNEQSRVALTEHYFFGRALMEIAEQRGAKLSAVKIWLFRARNDIREKLLARFGDDFWCDLKDPLQGWRKVADLR